MPGGTVRRTRRKRRRLRPLPVIVLFCILIFLAGKLFVNLGGPDAYHRIVAALSNHDGEASSDYYAVVVNAAYPLAEDFVPNDLAGLDGSEYKLEKTAAAAFTRMKAAMVEEGLVLNVESAYRSAAKQKELYEARVQAIMAQDGSLTLPEAQEQAKAVVNLPGTSEHQTGLAVDVSTDGYASNQFDQSPAGQWIIKNGADYGFILRYPADKTQVTGILYEPWHIRYVGEKLAKKITKSDLCLEEYFKKPVT